MQILSNEAIQEFTVFSLRKSLIHVVFSVKGQQYLLISLILSEKRFLSYNSWQFSREFNKSRKINLYLRIVVVVNINFI